MPLQKFHFEITTDPIPEQERADLGLEILRALNGVLAPYLPNRDGMNGEIVKNEVEEK